ncbi:MAG: YebC/PmpR family DNA-binding transcriptional regulator [Fidelibacterota bacterium]
MSGHSKWATIKRKKAATDSKRGKLFTKFIREIMIAARQGGGDPEGNPRLRQAIISAKSVNMPHENINRAIQKGTGELEGVDYEEVTYEGYAPGGVAIFIEVLTDNKNRTVAEIRHVMNKYDGNLGETGSVAWMFDKSGQITVARREVNEDKLFEDALEAGATDFSNAEDDFLISTDPADTANISELLEKNGYLITSSSIEMVPKTTVKIQGAEARKVINLLEALEELDDVQNLFSNFDLDEESN